MLEIEWITLALLNIYFNLWEINHFIMKLFSKLTFICNVSFVIFIILRYVDLNNKKGKVDDNISPLPFVTGSLVVLGQLAIFINIIFCLVALILMLSKKLKHIPQWLVIVNLIFLLIQFYYFFIY